MPLPDTPDESDERLSAAEYAEKEAADREKQAEEGHHSYEKRDEKAAETTGSPDFQRASQSGWNERLVFTVGGGLRGAVAYPEMKQTMARYRVAVAGTNMGHFSAQDGTKWVPNNPETWTDYGHRAVHLSTLVAKVAVSTFYDAVPYTNAGKAAARVPAKEDAPVFHSYFKGCSTGGRAAMAAVQRYPADFDGVIAGSPSIDFNKLKAYQVHVNTFLNEIKSAAYFPPAAYSFINKAVLKACDAQDGLVDGVVSFPRQCKPDFAKLIGCKSLGITPAPPKVGPPKDAGAKVPAGVPEGSKAPATEPKTPILPRDVADPPPGPDLTSQRDTAQSRLPQKMLAPRMLVARIQVQRALMPRMKMARTSRTRSLRNV